MHIAAVRPPLMNRHRTTRSQRTMPGGRRQSDLKNEDAGGHIHINKD